MGIEVEKAWKAKVMLFGMFVFGMLGCLWFGCLVFYSKVILFTDVSLS
jgi:hypothetical protein